MHDFGVNVISLIIAILLSPLVFGIINKTKAFFAGRVGFPLLQPYYDIYKLFRKDFVYSQTTTWIFRIGPIIGISVMLIILSMLQRSSLFSFEGDIILIVYLMGLARFFMVVAAIDTGSAFEGMGAAREIHYAIFAELSLMASLITLCLMTKEMSLSLMFEHLSINSWRDYAPTLTIVSCVIFTILLLENCRIPFDDPNTHLELTMIHEVMVLDHGSFDFGLIQYASALKFWIWSSILVHILLPGTSLLITIAGILSMGVAVGIAESTLARFKLVRIPSFMLGTFILSIFAMFLTR